MDAWEQNELIPPTVFIFHTPEISAPVLGITPRRTTELDWIGPIWTRMETGTWKRARQKRDLTRAVNIRIGIFRWIGSFIFWRIFTSGRGMG
jgi:hypothetical protein